MSVSVSVSVSDSIPSQPVADQNFFPKDTENVIFVEDEKLVEMKERVGLMTTMIHDSISEVKDKIFENNWDPSTYQFTLPDPLTDLQEVGSSGEGEESDVYSLFNKPFNANKFDVNEDKRKVSHNSNGDQRHLSPSQLKEIERTGNFSVMSTLNETVPNTYGIEGGEYKYVWSINRLFQKGSLEIRNTYNEGLVFATKQFVVTIPNRIWKGNVSLFDGIKSIGTGFVKALFLPFGLFSNEKSKKRTRLELDDLRITTLIEHLFEEKHLGGTEGMIEINLTTNEDEHISVKPLSLDVINALKSSEFKQDYQIFSKGIRLDNQNNRQALFEDISVKYPEENEDKLIDRVSQIEVDILQHAVYDFLRSKLQDYINETTGDNDDTELALKETIVSKESKATIASHIIELFMVIKVMRNFLDKRTKEKNVAIDVYRNTLRESHPILNEISEWRNDKICAFTTKWDSEHSVDDMLKFIFSTDVTPGLPTFEDMSVVFNHNMNIVSDVEYKKAESEMTKIPSKQFHWGFRIWKPSHCKITKISKIEERQIREVPLETDHFPVENQERWRYNVENHNEYSTSTRFIGWRIINFFIRAFMWMCNGAYWCLANMTFGPFGIRSLFGIEEFYRPNTHVDEHGKLQRCGSKHATWIGRIVSLWRNIKQSRDDFRDSPDTGFFGKSFTNPFNWMWNYIGKGFVGTIVTFFGHPLLTFLSTFISLILFLTSPVWALLGALLKYFFDILIYDYDGSFKEYPYFPLFQHIIWDIGIRGILQFILALFGIFGAILLSIAAFCFSNFRATVRTIYDFLVLNIIIRPLGRIPFEDSFTARMISGPSLSYDYYYEVNPEIVRMMVTIELLKKEMEYYIDAEKKKIGQYSSLYREFVSSFQKFYLHYASPSSKEGGETILEDTRKELEIRLSEQVEKYYSDLNIKKNNNFSPLGKSKMTNSNLDIVNNNLPRMCQEFYESRIIPCMSETELNEMWMKLKIPQLDYSALALYHLKSVFGEAILEPVEEADIYNNQKHGFRLEVVHLNSRRYFKEMWKGNISDDLEKVVISDSRNKLKKTLFEKIQSLVEKKMTELVTPSNFFRHYYQAPYEHYLYVTESQVNNYVQKKKDENNTPMITYQREAASFPSHSSVYPSDKLIF